MENLNETVMNEETTNEELETEEVTEDSNVESNGKTKLIVGGVLGLALTTVGAVVAWKQRKKKKKLPIVTVPGVISETIDVEAKHKEEA